jgi:multidrug efflux system membrane fusion protein
MRRLLLILLCLGLAAGGGYWWLHVRAAGEAPTAGAAGRGAAGKPIPVVVAPAETRDVPIWLDGLGTAQASALVTVKPMVDGPLMEVRFREGQDVAVGDVLARIDPRTYQAALDQQVAKKRQDEATLQNARLDLVRYTKLAATAYTSAQQADTQRSLVAQLEAQVAGDQAQIDNARALLSYTTIAAPIAGRIGMRLVDPGNIVHATDAAGLCVIATLRPIDVVFTLPQQSLADIRGAMAAGAPEVLALPQAAAPSAERSVLDRGTLRVIDNQVDQTTGTIKLKASFPNEQLGLWPGAFVTVRLRVRTWHDATVVPPVAVQRGPQGAYVYVVDADSKANRRIVTIGHEDITNAIIADGVKPGERVVIDGASRLTDGAAVAVSPSSGDGTAAAGHKPSPS